MTEEMPRDEIRDLRVKLLNACDGHSAYVSVGVLSETITNIVLACVPNLADALGVIDRLAMIMRNDLRDHAKERWPDDPRSEEPPSASSGFWNPKH